jgi:hypothetical protein
MSTPQRLPWTAGAMAVLAAGLAPACARESTSVAAPAAPPAANLPTLTAAAPPTARVGATLKAPIAIFPDRLTWGDHPAMLTPGAKMAVIEGDPSSPGALFAVRLKLPPNYKIMPHWHPTDEHVTVLTGSLLVGHGDAFAREAMTELPAGGFGALPASHHHFASSGNTETIIQVHAVGPLEFNYIDPADDPRSLRTK